MVLGQRSALHALRSASSTVRTVPLAARAASMSTSTSTSTSTAGPSSSSSSEPGPSSSSSRSQSSKGSSSKYLWLSAPLAAAAGYFFWRDSRRPLNPQVYSEQKISGNEPLSTGRHILLTIPVHDGEELAQFKETAVAPSGAAVPPHIVVVQHVMVRNPTLMIERPYTPINDTSADGEMKLVVKRVRGGEVGRLVHSLKPGDQLGVRGPIATFALNPDAFDTIVMISTGTAVAPFLQLLAKTPDSAHTKFKLLQAKPVSGDDWSQEYIAPLQAKWGDKLQVNRIDPGTVKRADVADALKGCGKVLVMVCLPPTDMRPLCGTLTPTLEQGPLTGLLADIGLKAGQVWKLE